MLTHEDDAGWFTRDDDGFQLLMFCPPQKRIVAVYLLAGVSGSITDPPEAGYVLTALLVGRPKVRKHVPRLVAGPI